MTSWRHTSQKYVGPKTDNTISSHPKHIFLGVDQMTVEIARSAQGVRSQSDTSLLRLEGLYPKVEDWHALVNFYQVCIYISIDNILCYMCYACIFLIYLCCLYVQIIWSTLYNTSSSADQGTLYQLHTVFQRRNVVTDPKNNFHACSKFLTSFRMYTLLLLPHMS